MNDVKASPTSRDKSRISSGWLVLPALAFLSLAFALPMAQVFRESFHTFVANGAVDTNFSIANYRELLTNPYYAKIALRTLKLAVATTIITGLIAFPLAYQIRRAKGAVRGLLIFIGIAPMLVSAVIRSIGWMNLTAPGGPISDLGTRMGSSWELWYTQTLIVIGLVHVQIPLMLLPILASMSQIPSNWLAAARTLGAKPFDVVRKIVLPLTMPGIISGATITFSFVSTTYVTPTLLGGAQSRVFASLIYESQLVEGDRAFAATLSVALLCTVALIIGFGNFFAWRWSRKLKGWN
jgi:putative spermidine/putrescine transport system permease protein